MNKRFSERLAYDWIWYVAVVIIAVCGWYFAFNSLHAPKDYEKIGVFFAGKATDYSIEETLAQDLLCHGVIDVSLATANPGDKTFYDKYTTAGLYSSDVLILPRSIADVTACSISFLEITEQYIAPNLPTECEYFSQEGITYGIILPDETIEALGQYLDFAQDEDYVMVISIVSVNAGDDGMTDNALHAINLILSQNK